MKKVVALFILAIMCLIFLVGCTAKTEKQDLAVYSFSGANDYFSVTDGVIVLSGEEETFSGGQLNVRQDELFSDIVSYDADFYIIKNGERRTVLSSSVLDMTGSSVRLNGDSLGKISGETIITNYKMIAEEDWQNNLFFELTVTDLEEKESVYELQMNLTKITDK